MDVLVTGGSGFLGAHLVETLRRRGDTVTNADLQSRNDSEKVDVTEERALADLFARTQPSVVVHLASLATVPDCERRPADCFMQNVRGTWTVARLAAKHRARLVFASTAAVYGEPSELPTPVTAPARPTSLYGHSKAVGEAIVRSFDRDATVLRIFNAYGPGCSRTYVIPDTIRKIRGGGPRVPMQGTGQESRDFVFVRDVVSAFVIAVDHPHPGTYNLGRGETSTISTVSAEIARLMGRPEITFEFEGPRIGDFSINWADTRPPNVLPGWTPLTGLTAGLELTLNAEAPDASPGIPRKSSS